MDELEKKTNGNFLQFNKKFARFYVCESRNYAGATFRISFEVLVSREETSPPPQLGAINYEFAFYF